MTFVVGLGQTHAIPTSVAIFGLVNLNVPKMVIVFIYHDYQKQFINFRLKSNCSCLVAVYYDSLITKLHWIKLFFELVANSCDAHKNY